MTSPNFEYFINKYEGLSLDELESEKDKLEKKLHKNISKTDDEFEVIDFDKNWSIETSLMVIEKLIEERK